MMFTCIRQGSVGKKSFVCSVVTALALLLTGISVSSIRTKRYDFNVNLRLRPGKVGCIKVAENFFSGEGVGAQIKRTQFAFFLASILKVDISYPSFKSDHGYFLHELFSECTEAEPSCHLNEEAAIIARCPRGDCECMKRNVAPHVIPLARRCSVISVENVKDRTMEYGGCLTYSMKRYLGMSHPPWERRDYDAIHIRKGDLANRTVGKAYHPRELKVLLKQMCLLSNRDIVVVTEKAPQLPVVEECGDRLVLAGENTLKEAFGILQHAKHVSLGLSSFALLMSEVIQPERMIIVERAAQALEWINCEKWTVLSNQYSVFHFDSREMMLRSVVERSLKFRSYYTSLQKQQMSYNLTVPRRRWSNDTSWIITRRE